MKIYLNLATAAAVVFSSVPVMADETQDFLPPQEAIEILADGAPWSASTPTGRNFKLTLNKDGTGDLREALPFALSVSWTIKGEEVCLSSTMMAKCLRFREIAGGLQSWNGDKVDLKLIRQKVNN